MNGTPGGREPDRAGRFPDLGEDLRSLLERFAGETFAGYARLAQQWIDRLRIDRRGLIAEGAVDAAWVLVCQDVRDGHIRPTVTRAELDPIFHFRLLKVLFDEYRRQHAEKRGWGMVVSMGDDVPEVADRHGVAPGESVAGDDWVAWVLDQLDGHNPVLRSVLVGKTEGRTTAEIAAELGVSVSTVERMAREIRSLVGPYLEERG